MKRVVWKVDEIRALPEFGADSGWFYGLVVFNRRVYLAEIFPGLGFVSIIFWEDLKRLRQILSDIRRYRPPKGRW